MSDKLAPVSDSSIERVLINGDLSRLNEQQRVSYYKAVCDSVGLNPLTRPFDYITLNGRLTLYARKDATDQLRKLHNVSIDDVDVKDTETHFIVKVKGHDATGRSDVEIGVVAKSEMQGNIGNAQMKAVTKAKRRLTLSLCGLGMLDETEVETIPDAKPLDAPVIEVVDSQVEITYEQAIEIVGSDNNKYGDCTTDELERKVIGIQMALKNPKTSVEKQSELLYKLSAAKVILEHRKAE